MTRRGFIGSITALAGLSVMPEAAKTEPFIGTMTFSSGQSQSIYVGNGAWIYVPKTRTSELFPPGGTYAFDGQKYNLISDLTV